MKKKGIRKFLVIIIISIGMLILMTVNSKAAFQANKSGSRLTTISSGNLNNMFVGIRKMEILGGTLGKNASLEAITYLDTSKNGIDSHMIKNTEYGTVELLTRSSYGGGVKSGDNSNTGNDSGV